MFSKILPGYIFNITLIKLNFREPNPYVNGRYRTHNGPAYPLNQHNGISYASMRPNQFASMPRRVKYAHMPRNELYSAQTSVPDDYSVEMPPPPPSIR